MKFMNKIALTLFSIAALGASNVWATYSMQRELGLPSDPLIQGRDYTFEIQHLGNDPSPIRIVGGGGPCDNFDIDAGGAEIVLVNGQTIYQPGPNGLLVFNIRFNSGGCPVTISLINHDDVTDQNNVAFTIQKIPRSYTLSNPIPSVDAGVTIYRDITVRDEDGNAITNYEDGVKIWNSQDGPSFTTQVNFGGFNSAGTASNAPILINSGRLSDRRTDLTIRQDSTQGYFEPSGLPSAPAELVIPNITVDPDSFARLVMLFPGETLTPGQGKDPSGIQNQTAGIEVSRVDIYAVDQYFNPTDEVLPTNITFEPAADPESNLPNSTPMDPTGILTITNTSPIPFEFLSVKTHSISAIPDGDATKSSVSNVPVQQGPVSGYAFVTQPTNTKTDQTIQIQIEALNGLNVRDTAVDGVIPGLNLFVVQVGGAENAGWVDTNVGTPAPENMEAVNWVDGLATINLQVTKVGSQVKLKLVDSVTTNEVESNVFSVAEGAMSRIHFSIRGVPGNVTGEIPTPGLYPGNAGAPLNVQAGQNVIVDAYVTDKWFNIISNGNANGVELEMDPSVGSYIEVDYPAPGVNPAVFNSNGRFTYDFGSHFIVRFRTAGTQRLVGVAPSVGGGSHQSSPVNVLPGPYEKIVIKADGETLAPGIFPTPAEYADGKTGTPDSKPVGIPFGAVVYATDRYFNPINILPTPAPTYNITLNPTVPTANNVYTGNNPTVMSGNTQIITNKFNLQTGANITVTDPNTSFTQTVSIPVGYGVIDHFALLIDATDADYAAAPPAPKTEYEAGELTRVRLEARDEYDNVVLNYAGTVNLLAVNSGAGTINPESISITPSDNGAKVFDLQIYAAGLNKLRMSQGGIQTVTEEFTVRVNDNGYQNLVMILNGETLRPGLVGNNGKEGLPTPVTVPGDILATVYATDLYFNPLMPQAPVRRVKLTSSLYSSFAPDEGNIQPNSTNQGIFTTSIFPRTAGTHTILVKDLNNGSLSSESTLVVNHGTFKKLQVIAPGESADPGTFQANGKTSTPPTNQKVATPFSLEIRAVDDYWNVVPSVNDGDIDLFSQTTQEILFSPPNNSQTTTSDLRPFTAGIANRTVIVGKEGLTEIGARSLQTSHLTKSPHTVEVNVNPGPTYVFTTPAQATAGQNFNVQVELRDPLGNLVDFDESVFLTAVFESNNLPARGAFSLPPEGNPMVDGVLDINLNYAYVERIRIKLVDGFGRIAFSDPIEVIPSGLKYNVIVPSEAIVGPPENFTVRVELRDQNTGTLVTNYDHGLVAEVLSSANEATTAGVSPVPNPQLSQGVAEFTHSYTKAEYVFVRVRETSDPNKDLDGFDPAETNSTSINMKPDKYTKLVIMAPGETQVEGLPTSATNPNGKSGLVNAQQVGIPFLVQIRGVDQYWNTTKFDGGTIHLSSDDDPMSITANNPVNQDGPLSTGESAAFIKLLSPGLTKVRVADLSNPLIGTQEVQVNVGGVFYEVIINNNPIFAGPETPFSMTVRLKDSISDNVVLDAQNQFTIEAIKPDGITAGGGVLAVTKGKLVNGVQTIANQSYTKAEQVFLRITDSNNNVGQSPVITVISRAIRYVWEIPSEAEVNVGFDVTVRAIDAFTGLENVAINRSVSLDAFSFNGGVPVSGNFVPSQIEIVNGVGRVSAVYDKMEPIFLRLTDTTDPTDPSLQPPTNPTFTSPGQINVRAGAIESFEITDFQMQANETRTVTILARDRFANLVPNNNVRVAVNNIPGNGDLMINGQSQAYAAKTNSLGELVVTFDPVGKINGEVEVRITDIDRQGGYSKLIKIDLLGLGVRPAGALGDQNRIPVFSSLMLDIPEETGTGGVVTTYYRVDGGAWTVYNPNVGIVWNDASRGYNVFDETREYAIEWYSERCFPAVDPTCSNPVSELDIQGAPNFAVVATYNNAGKLSGYPSPFNPSRHGSMYIQFPLSQTSSVEVDIYDLFGHKVKHFDISSAVPTGTPTADHYQFPWDGTNEDGQLVANGGYIVRVKVGGTTMKTKVLVVK